MADVVTAFAEGSCSTSLTDEYTSSGDDVVTCVCVCNHSGSTQNVKVKIRGVFVLNNDVPGTVILNGNWKLDNGDKVQLQADSTSVDFTIDGVHSS